MHLLLHINLGIWKIDVSICGAQVGRSFSQNALRADTNWLESVFVLINGFILEIFSFFFYLKFSQLAHFTCIPGFSPAAEMFYAFQWLAEPVILNNSSVYLFQNTRYNFF